ncbi:hypothetical protein TNCV_2490171 [Trichonephila clavipes]|nr:hypothetical protein TNCV_2490171 [Trichonephila clavipes]
MDSLNPRAAAMFRSYVSRYSEPLDDSLVENVEWLVSECVRNDRRQLLHKSLKLHASRRRRLKESIRRKRPQFWQSENVLKVNWWKEKQSTLEFEGQGFGAAGSAMLDICDQNLNFYR